MKPSGIAFICFHDTGNDLSCHYRAIKPIGENNSNEQEINILENKGKLTKEKINQT